jgi:hypothetical protein
VFDTKDIEEISGRAGGTSKLDGRLRDEIDDELDDDEEEEVEDADDVECRCIRTPESLSLVKDNWSRSDAQDVEEIPNAERCDC